MEFNRLTSEDITDFRGLMVVFANAFNEKTTYMDSSPRDEYVQHLLNKNHIIHLVAKDSGQVIGGLVAYVLEKFEQERAEVYIYDLAVAEDYRRQGVATRLIEDLKNISKEIGAWVIFVQADLVDPPAIKLYESLGVKEEVLHFDIKV